MKKIMLVPVFMLLLVGIVSAMSCDYDKEPYVKLGWDKIVWYCNLNVQNLPYVCWSNVYYMLENGSIGDIIQVNPEMHWELEYGYTNEFFESDDGHLLAYFTDDNVFIDTPYYFEVECIGQGGSWEKAGDIIIPRQKTMNEVATTYIWIKENWAYIIALFVIAFFIALAVKIIKLWW